MQKLLDLTRLREHWALIALLGAFCISLSLNVSLGWQIAKQAPPKRGGLQLGAIFNGLAVKDGSGAVSKLEFSESTETLLYVLSPNCGWCKRNERNINTLATSLSGRFRVLGLSIGERPLEFVAYQFPVVTLNHEADISRLGLEGTPQTAVLDKNGQVKRVWVGAYLSPIKEQLEAELHVQLPGLSKEHAATTERGSAQ